MAPLFPSSLPTRKQNGGLFRELDVIERLQQSLPDNYEIFHSVSLHTIASEVDRFGEIDVVVLDPLGKLLLMEVKAGAVVIRDGQIFKLYSNAEKDIGRQSGVQYAAMRNRLKEAEIATTVATCLVIPDYAIKNAHVVSIPKERIIDADHYDNLGTLVREFLTAGNGCADVPALRQFLRNEFRVSTDLSIIRDQVQATVRQLSDGLATWVPRIAPFTCFNKYQIDSRPTCLKALWVFCCLNQSHPTSSNINILMAFLLVLLKTQASGTGIWEFIHRRTGDKGQMGFPDRPTRQSTSPRNHVPLLSIPDLTQSAKGKRLAKLLRCLSISLHALLAR